MWDLFIERSEDEQLMKETILDCIFLKLRHYGSSILHIMWNYNGFTFISTLISNQKHVDKARLVTVNVII